MRELLATLGGWQKECWNDHKSKVLVFLLHYSLWPDIGELSAMKKQLDVAWSSSMYALRSMLGTALLSATWRLLPRPYRGVACCGDFIESWPDGVAVILSFSFLLLMTSQEPFSWKDDPVSVKL